MVSTQTPAHSAASFTFSQSTDPGHHENRGLRLAMQHQVPLVYFHGIVPGLYAAEWPVFIVGDDPAALTFTVSVDERRFASLDSSGVQDEPSTLRPDPVLLEARYQRFRQAG